MSIEVELFTGNVCANCALARERLETVIAQLGSEYFELLVIDVVGQIDHAVAIGVVATPAIAINGELVFTGLPGFKPLLTELRAALSDNAMRKK